MTGSLAYRAWYTAPEEFHFPVPEVQKRIAARRCNGCGTQYSRYCNNNIDTGDQI
jgi:hypothetical protein